MTEEPAPRALQATHSPAPARGAGPGSGRPPQGDTAPRFDGHDGRQCGEHRTTGHRAWCFDCSEWCYPNIPCRGCELPRMRALLAAIWLYVDWRYVTRQLTTEQKELWADAIEATSDPNDRTTVDRWWRE